MKFHLVSVPFTGTRFVRKLLKANGISPLEEIHTYVQAKWHEWFDGPVLVPMRDPILHAITCVNLGRDHNDGLFRLRDFDLLAGLAKPQTHFFRVDTDDHLGEMDRLARFLGVRHLSIDWTPEGASEDRTGLKADYLKTGEVPNSRWLDEIGPAARKLLRGLGYRMKWLDA